MTAGFCLFASVSTITQKVEDQWSVFLWKLKQHQNFMNCSLAHCQNFMRMSLEIEISS